MSEPRCKVCGEDAEQWRHDTTFLRSAVVDIGPVHLFETEPPIPLCKVCWLPLTDINHEPDIIEPGDVGHDFQVASDTEREEYQREIERLKRAPCCATCGGRKMEAAAQSEPTRPAVSERRFPIQDGGTIDWASAEHAYLTYVKFGGSGQALERVAERGGFGIAEFCLLYRGERSMRRGFQNVDHVAREVLAVVRELGDRWQP